MIAISNEREVKFSLLGWLQFDLAWLSDSAVFVYFSILNLKVNVDHIKLWTSALLLAILNTLFVRESTLVNSTKKAHIIYFSMSFAIFLSVVSLENIGCPFSLDNYKTSILPATLKMIFHCWMTGEILVHVTEYYWCKHVSWYFNVLKLLYDQDVFPW